MQISKDLFDLFKDLKDNVIALDSELNITHVNNSQDLVFGKETKGIIGRNIYTVDPHTAEKIFSEEILESVSKKEIVEREWENDYNGGLWRTTIFPAADGMAMISRPIPTNYARGYR